MKFLFQYCLFRKASTISQLYFYTLYVFVYFVKESPHWKNGRQTGLLKVIYFATKPR